MCDFCHKHGEGKKWYMQARNYSDDLLSDVRRRHFIEHFFTHPEELGENARRLADFERTPRFVQNVMTRLITRRMKKIHYGQVLPIEDIEQIFEFVNSVTRVACICRHVIIGQEKRYCYGIALSPDSLFHRLMHGLDASFLAGPDGAGLETLSREEAISAFRSHEHEGLCHTIWTFHTPFIGGLCNCDRTDCLAMRSTVTHAIPVMFRAEYVAMVDPDLCQGCRQCMRVCQFGAISYSASHRKAVVNQKWCYGCGICRSVCPEKAIHLQERSQVPLVADLW